MCEPATLLVASMLFTAGAGYVQGKSQEDAGKYQAAVSKQNAELSDLRASQAATIGSIQEEQHRAKVRQMAGAQRAQYAANGIDLGSGVVQDMLDQTITMGETDALTIRYNAMNEAWGYRTQAVNDRNEGRFAEWSGKQQKRGTFMTTAANLVGQGIGGYQAGVFRGSSGATGGTNYSVKTGANYRG